MIDTNSDTNSGACLENTTIEDVEPKYREFVKSSMLVLSSSSLFKNMNDEWELRIHTDSYINKTGFCKYLLLFWSDPYTYYIEIYKNNRILFKVVDSDTRVAVLHRWVADINLHLKEIDFFIDSVENYFNIKCKLDKFANEYEVCDLPLGYLRSEKIEQILK